MKKLLFIGTLFLMLGFSPINQEKFEVHAELFYIQMFVDGEQSEKVTMYYEDLTHIFSRFSGDPLYQELELMYLALGEKGKSAEPHRMKVLELLNERQ